VPDQDANRSVERFLDSPVPGQLGETITLYVLGLETEDTSALTRYAYKKELTSFSERWLDKQPADITRDDVVLWLADRCRGLSPSVKRRALVALNGYFEYLVDSGRIAANPCRGIKRPPRRRREPSYWTEAEVARILAAADTPRNRLLLETLARTGQRLDVVRTLTWDRIRCFDDGDRRDPVIRFPRGKNGEYHSVQMHPELVRRFHAYRLGVEPEPGDYVFRSQKIDVVTGGQRPIARNRAWNIIQQTCERAKVRRAGAHEFRRSLATMLLNDPNVSFLAVSKGILNHKNPETTMSCYAGAHSDEVGRALRGVGF
jgi:integrase